MPPPLKATSEIHPLLLGASARHTSAPIRKRGAVVARQLLEGKTDDTPERLNTPGKRALYNNLNLDEELALRIDETVKRVRPNGFRGVQAKENVIKSALLPLLGNREPEVERIFLIIAAQIEY